MLAGLEIKREVLVGHLASWAQRALPGFAALGGMAVPALIYVAINQGNSETIDSWAIPSATNIAFAISVLSLLGKRVSVSLKIFLSALAILDDLGAVLIIALFYTGGLSVPMLLAALGALLVLVGMNKLGVRKLSPYLIAGALLWFFMLQSRVHVTLAGVALALCIPLGQPDEAAARPFCTLNNNCTLGPPSRWHLSLDSPMQGCPFAKHAQIANSSSAGIEAPQAIPIRLRSRLTEVACAME